MISAPQRLRTAFYKIPTQSTVSTRQSFSGPIDMLVVAKTEMNDIRLYAFNGACVIFNWANNREELHVTRPDGNEKVESGSLATAKVRPLDPKTWYTLRWIITEEGMQVSVDDKVVFSESRSYDLSAKRPAAIRTYDSVVSVKVFEVKPVVRKSEPKPAAPDAAALGGRR